MNAPIRTALYRKMPATPPPRCAWIAMLPPSIQDEMAIICGRIGIMLDIIDRRVCEALRSANSTEDLVRRYADRLRSLGTVSEDRVAARLRDLRRLARELQALELDR